MASTPTQTLASECICTSQALERRFFHTPPGRIEEVIETIGLPAQTDQTITDPDELRAELKDIRERGFVLNKEEGMHGLQTIGVTVLYPDGELFGAFSVSGPSHRMRGDRFHEEIPNMLLGKAHEYEL
jgi:DNA-binding IclR family transcriptional regulator